MVRVFKIIKKPRQGSIPDYPIDFSPLENLHLELLENKRKLKPGLPEVRIDRKPLRIKVREDKREEYAPPDDREERVEERKETDDEHDEVQIDDQEYERVEIDDADLDMVAALGDDPSEDDRRHYESDREKEKDSDREERHDEKEEPEEEKDFDPYAGLTPEEREAKEKEEFLWKFYTLKKKSKGIDIEIPVVNEHTDLQTMKQYYARTEREIKLDRSVDSYRGYLVGSWMVMEFVATQWIGVDLGGFTLQQTKMMYKYDDLLFELGEKAQDSWAMNLPVEIRLLGFILLQAGTFYLGKIISTKFGNNIAELFKGVTGQPPEQKAASSQTTDEKPKRKMRGPRIKAADIRKMSQPAREHDSSDWFVL